MEYILLITFLIFSTYSYADRVTVGRTTYEFLDEMPRGATEDHSDGLFISPLYWKYSPMIRGLNVKIFKVKYKGFCYDSRLNKSELTVYAAGRSLTRASGDHLGYLPDKDKQVAIDKTEYSSVLYYFLGDAREEDDSCLFMHFPDIGRTKLSFDKRNLILDSYNAIDSVDHRYGHGGFDRILNKDEIKLNWRNKKIAEIKFNKKIVDLYVENTIVDNKKILKTFFISYDGRKKLLFQQSYLSIYNSHTKRKEMKFEVYQYYFEYINDINGDGELDFILKGSGYDEKRPITRILLSNKKTGQFDIRSSVHFLEKSFRP